MVLLKFSHLFRSAGSLYSVNVHGDAINAQDIQTVSANISGTTHMNSAISSLVSTDSLMVYNKSALFGNIETTAMNISKHSVFINATIETSKSMVVSDSLSVGKELKANKVTTSYLNASSASLGNLSIDGNATVNGTLTSQNGFSTKGIQCMDIVSRGNIISQANISSVDLFATGNAHVQKNVSAQSMFVSDALNASSISATYLHVMSNVTIGGGLKGTSKVNMNADVSINGTLTAVESEFNSCKTSSIFSSRIYTNDLAANGFVSASEIFSKGNIDVKGVITGEQAKINEMQGGNLVVNESITCGTASVLGELEAAGVVAQKVTVKSSLIVNGKNVAEELNDLEKIRRRVDELEKLLSELEKSISI